MLARPTRSLRHLDPRRLGEAGLIADDERLIGLLLLKNEADVLDEFLDHARRWFDRILVLDGTTEDPAETTRILTSVPEVVYVARDEEVMGGRPTRDGARQYLLEEARRRYGIDNWIGILHADEFMDADPRPLLASRRPSIDPSIRVRLVHAFLHVDDEPGWEALSGLPVTRRLSHCMWPGVPESRFFFDAGDRDYEVNRHSKTIPNSFRPGPLIDGFTIVQYNERSPEQIQARARQRMADGWQTGHYARFTEHDPPMFVESLDTVSEPFAPEFVNPVDGPFLPLPLSAVGVGAAAKRPGPVFLGGDLDAIQRSTDAVARLYNARVLPETIDYLTEPDGLLDLAHRVTPRRLRLFDRRMAVLQANVPGNWGFHANGGPTPRRDFVSRAVLLRSILTSRRVSRRFREIAAADFVRRMHERYAHTPDRWLDRTPSNIERADDLLGLFPDAVLVHAVQDPLRAVMADSLRGMDPFESIGRLSARHGSWIRAKARWGMDRCLEERVDVDSNVLADDAFGSDAARIEHRLAPLRSRLGYR